MTMTDEEWRRRNRAQEEFFGAIARDDTQAMKDILRLYPDATRRYEVDDDRTEETALYRAAWMGCLDAVKILVEGGALLEAPSLGNKKFTPLIAAVNNRHADIAELLLRQGANPNYRDGEGFSALSHAVCAGGCLRSAALLLDHGAKPDLLSGRGTPPLVYAASLARMDMIELLIRRGANAAATDWKSLDAAATARGNSRPDIAAFIEKCAEERRRELERLEEERQAAFQREFEAPCTEGTGRPVRVRSLRLKGRFL